MKHEWQFFKAVVEPKTGWVTRQAHRFCERCGTLQYGGPQADYAPYLPHEDCDEMLVRHIMMQ
jgi:hypothetical protein